MKIILLSLLLIVLPGCTVGEALLGAGAAGLGGYLLGEHSENNHPTRYYHCERGPHYDRCY